jgi:prophage regulatory protein
MSTPSASGSIDSNDASRYASLPVDGFVRAAQFLGDRKRGIPPLLPISRSAWYAGVASGRWPPGIKLGPRTTAWKSSAIRSILAEFERAA